MNHVNQLKAHPFQSSGFRCQPAPLHHELWAKDLDNLEAAIDVFEAEDAEVGRCKLDPRLKATCFQPLIPESAYGPFNLNPLFSPSLRRYAEEKAGLEKQRRAAAKNTTAKGKKVLAAKKSAARGEDVDMGDASDDDFVPAAAKKKPSAAAAAARKPAAPKSVVRAVQVEHIRLTLG